MATPAKPAPKAAPAAAPKPAAAKPTAAKAAPVVAAKPAPKPAPTPVAKPTAPYKAPSEQEVLQYRQDLKDASEAKSAQSNPFMFLSNVTGQSANKLKTNTSEANAFVAKYGKVDPTTGTPWTKTTTKASTPSEALANQQLTALANDKSGLMEFGRTAAAFTPVIGTGAAIGNAVGAAQRGDKTGTLLYGLQAVAPMGIGAAGKIASKAAPYALKAAEKVAPKTTAAAVAGAKAVGAAASKVGAKVNTKVVQPINSKITSVISDPVPVVKSAQGIVTSASKVESAAKNLPKQEKAASTSGKSVVSEAQNILKQHNTPVTPNGQSVAKGAEDYLRNLNKGGDTGPSFGGGTGPKFTPKPGGPSGGVGGKQQTVARQVFDQRTGTYKVISQPVTSRTGSVASGNAGMSYGVPSVTKSVNGGLTVGGKTTVLERPNVGQQFSTHTFAPSTTKTGTVPPALAPVKPRELPTVNPITAPKPKPVEPIKPPTTPAKPVESPNPWKPRTEPIKPATPAKEPGVGPHIPLRSPVTPKPSPITKPGTKPTTGQGASTVWDAKPTNNVGKSPESNYSPKPGTGPLYTPKPGGAPQPGPSNPNKTPTTTTTTTTSSPRSITRVIPASERNATQGAIQSNWADYRGAYTGHQNTGVAIDPLHESEAATAASESGRAFTPRRRSASFEEGKTTYTPITTVIP